LKGLEIQFVFALSIYHMIDSKASLLECGDQSPLWSAVTGHRMIESTQAGVAATGRDPTKR